MLLPYLVLYLPHRLECQHIPTHRGQARRSDHRCKRFELRGNADTERELAAFHAAAPGIEEDKFPDSFLPLLAKLCQDSPQPLTPLAKAVYKALLPDDLECNLSLITINDAIQLACERKYYGVKPQRGVTTAEDASANAHWLWQRA